MRSLSPAALAALQRSPLPMAMLVFMDLSEPLRLNTGSIDLTIDGVTWYGARGLGKVEAVQDSPAEIRPLRFELSGVPSSRIALARTERVQGRAAAIYAAIFDPDTYQLLDVRLRRACRLDVLVVEDSPAGATIQVTAEDAAIDLLRPVTSLYSDAEQRRLHPGDPSLQYMADQAEQRITWPAASWGRQ